MKKILLLFLPAVMLVSCSKDNASLESENALNSIEASQAMESQRQELLESDNYIGIYKGVFTTNNSASRATVEVIIPKLTSVSELVVNRPTAILTLVDGSTRMATASVQPTLAAEVGIEQLRFSSDALSFQLSVNSDGTNATVENVIYNQLDASIWITKSRITAPVTPITGTYACTDCQDHPFLNSGSAQTWNVVIDENTGNITSQVAFGSMVFNGIGIRENCSEDGDFTYCDVMGGDGDGDVAFSVMGDEVTWSGSLKFSNLPSDPDTDCSEMNGEWSLDSSNYGLITGTFESDNSCEPTSTYILLNEDFQAFTGSGFSPGALSSTGRLDSNRYRATGLQQNNMDFGDTRLSGAFARGISYGGATLPGIYAFNVGSGNIAAGIKPSGFDWTPGFFGIKVQNSTGTHLNRMDISFDVYINNVGDRGNSLKFSYSTDGINYTDIPALQFITPTTADSNGFMSISASETFNANVAEGDFIYLRLTGDDAMGTGARDEFAVDNLLLEAQ